MKQMIKLSLTLAAYAIVACLALALVYTATKPYIEAAKSAEVQTALRQIFPDAAGFTDVSTELSSGSSSIVFEKAYTAYNPEGIIGVVVQVTGPTYASATLLVGVDMQRTIRSVVFITLTDTAGIGTKVRESPFIDQFVKKSVDDSFELDGDVQGVSGATISSSGVAAILKLTGYHAGEYLVRTHGATAGTGTAPVPSGDLSPFTLTDALEDLFPGADFEDISGAVTNTVNRSTVFESAWLARSGGLVKGVAVVARGATYKSTTLTVGVRPDLSLAGVRINSTTDSRNFGARMVNQEFWGQFTGKPVDDLFLVKGPTVSNPDVDVLTGATISTKGVANMIKVSGWEASRYLAAVHGGRAPALGAGSLIFNVLPDVD